MRASLFARGLAQREGFDVSFIVHDHGQPKLERIDSVSVRSAFPSYQDAPIAGELIERASRCGRRRKGFPGFEIYRWKPSLLWQIPTVAACLFYRNLTLFLKDRESTRVMVSLLHDIGADVYCCFGVHSYARTVMDYCHRMNKQSVLFIAHEYDLNFALTSEPHERNIYGDTASRCQETLTKAKHIVVQSVDQQRLLSTGFGRQSTVIRNPIDLAADEPGNSGAARDCVLWVGRTDPLKRPERVLELARRCRDIPFVMILSGDDRIMADRLRADAPANLQILGRVPYTRIKDYFQRAAVLVSTSDGEGFPNIFLQAGKYGVPIVSLFVDPDGFISRNGCGCIAGGSMDRLVRAVVQLWSDRHLAEQYASALRSYVESTHGLDGRVSELSGLLREIAEKSTANPQLHLLRNQDV